MASLSSSEFWADRVAAFCSQAPLPRWSPECVADSEMHAHYERFLPLAEWLPYLRDGLAEVLPGADWMPGVMSGAATSWRSVIDFWRLVPENWHHRLAWEGRDEWWALACALAAPRRFGTGRGRYPEQLELLEARAGTLVGLVLDVGCGTGQGTWEMAQILGRQVQVAGVTAEPLEVWMARHRELPHLNSMVRSDYPEGDIEPLFWAGDALTLRVSQPASLIVCNGLAGGPAMRDESALRQLWATFLACSAPNAEIWLANSFHDGFRDADERFAQLRPVDWECEIVGKSRIFRRI